MTPSVFLIFYLIKNRILKELQVKAKDIPLIISKSNFENEYANYLDSVLEMKLQLEYKDNYDFFYSVKRKQVEKGPYPNVTAFEAANRIMSDLVIWGALEILLYPNEVLPFTFDEFTIKLGNKSGIDIEATKGNEKLIGEAFNVAPSFFYQKCSKERKDLIGNNSAQTKIITYNIDAVEDKFKKYTSFHKDKNNIWYLPINVDFEKLRVLDIAFNELSTSVFN